MFASLHSVLHNNVRNGASTRWWRAKRESHQKMGRLASSRKAYASGAMDIRKTCWPRRRGARMAAVRRTNFGQDAAAAYEGGRHRRIERCAKSGAHRADAQTSWAKRDAHMGGAAIGGGGRKRSAAKENGAGVRQRQRSFIKKISSALRNNVNRCFHGATRACSYICRSRCAPRRQRNGGSNIANQADKTWHGSARRVNRSLAIMAYNDEQRITHNHRRGWPWRGGKHRKCLRAARRARRRAAARLNAITECCAAAIAYRVTSGIVAERISCSAGIAAARALLGMAQHSPRWQLSVGRPAIDHHMGVVRRRGKRDSGSATPRHRELYQHQQTSSNIAWRNNFSVSIAT